MPAYSFKERFVPMILDGTKRQTIRALRTGRQGHAMAGDTVYLYFGMRTKWCKKLGESKCTGSQPIEILQNGEIWLYDNQLRLNAIRITDKNAFAWDDGFRPEGSTRENPARAFDLMITFWMRTHSLPFKGWVIYWEEIAKKEVPAAVPMSEDPDLYFTGEGY